MTTTFGVREVVIGNAAGFGLTVIGWIGASGEAAVSQQTAWANLAVAGTGLLAAVNARWLLNRRRAVIRHFRAVTGGPARLGAIPAFALGQAPLSSSVNGQARRPAPLHDHFVASPSMRWYHRPGCELAAGKQLVTDSRPAHELAGRGPCGVCRP